MSLDPAPLWDFDDPAGSEARFREAAERAEGSDRLVLLTQVARALGLQERYDEAHAVLDGLDDLGGRTFGVDARMALERGRLVRSAGDPEDARDWFETALAVADEADDDALRVDALHMLGIVETVPATAVRLNRKALRLARASEDPAARRWEASLLNNLGCAFVDAGRAEKALPLLEEARALRAARGEVAQERVARWTLGWALRHAGRSAEALAVQRALQEELAASGESDPWVSEELALLQGGVP